MQNELPLPMTPKQYGVSKKLISRTESNCNVTTLPSVLNPPYVKRHEKQECARHPVSDDGGDASDTDNNSACAIMSSKIELDMMKGKRKQEKEN